VGALEAAPRRPTCCELIANGWACFVAWVVLPGVVVYYSLKACGWLLIAGCASRGDGLHYLNLLYS